MLPYPWASRIDDRELGLRGVVGLEEGRGRDEERASASMTMSRLGTQIGGRSWDKQGGLRDDGGSKRATRVRCKRSCHKYETSTGGVSGGLGAIARDWVC